MIFQTEGKIFPQVEKSKVKIGVCFIAGISSKIKFQEHFVLFNFWIRRTPEALRACQNRQEKGPIPGSLNKSWEFGGHA